MLTRCIHFEYLTKQKYQMGYFHHSSRMILDSRKLYSYPNTNEAFSQENTLSTWLPETFDANHQNTFLKVFFAFLDASRVSSKTYQWKLTVKINRWFIQSSFIQPIHVMNNYSYCVPELCKLVSIDILEFIFND